MVNPDWHDRLLADCLGNCSISLVYINSKLRGKGVKQMKAPEISGIEAWINSEPLSLNQLRGKVILVDFWTFSCINCLRTIPFLKRWSEKYKDKGFILLGVHTPEFEFEKKLENVQDAVRRLKLPYPVALDNNYQTWNAFANHYWPAHYLINKEGKIVREHFGEGDYEETEEAIMKALNQPGQVEPMFEQEMLGKIGTPEIYFGLKRVQWIANSEIPDTEAKEYKMPQSLDPNFFGIEGKWRFAPEYLELEGETGKIRLNFFAGKVHMVAESGTFKPVKLKVSVDQKPVKELEVEASMLYTLFDSEDYSPHTLEVETEKGLKAYTFTFG